MLVGGPAPLTLETTDPSPPPLPPLLAPAPPVLPGQPLLQYPPYIPETQVDTSHLPESSIAGVHGDYEDVVLWPPPWSGVGDAGTPGPGSLPPYWLKNYREIAPGVWVPGTRADDPGCVHPAGMSNWTGQGADAAKDQQAKMAAARRTRDEADQGLGETVNDTHAAAQRTQERLRKIQAEIDAGVRALQPTLDTTAGQQQMANFLAAKARETQSVIEQARQASTSSATAFSEVGTRYSTIV